MHSDGTHGAVNASNEKTPVPISDRNLRDYFAAAVDLGITWRNTSDSVLFALAGPRPPVSQLADTARWWARAEATVRYLVADAMLAVRRQTAPADTTKADTSYEPSQVRNALLLVSSDPPFADVLTWSADQLRQAFEWAGAVHLHASDNDDVVVPPKPAFLAAYDVDWQGNYLSPRDGGSAS